MTSEQRCDNMNYMSINITEASKYVGLAVKTLQRLDRENKLVAFRTETNRRYYTKEQLDIFLHKGFKKEKKTIVYCRVSSGNQKQDLRNQRKVLEDFCSIKGYENPSYIEEIGGGLNFKRPKFIKIIQDVEQFEIDKLVVAHKDRLCRFGYEWFDEFCKNHGCEIIVLNQEQLSPEEEMVQDLMTIIHCFSSRLYGLRNYKKKLKEAIKSDTSTQN